MNKINRILDSEWFVRLVIIVYLTTTFVGVILGILAFLMRHIQT